LRSIFLSLAITTSLVQHRNIEIRAAAVGVKPTAPQHQLLVNPLDLQLTTLT
jgi:hypothetical protein